MTGAQRAFACGLFGVTALGSALLLVTFGQSLSRFQQHRAAAVSLAGSSPPPQQLSIQLSPSSRQADSESLTADAPSAGDAAGFSDPA